MADVDHDPLCCHSDSVRERLSAAVCVFCTLIRQVRAHDAEASAGLAEVIDLGAVRAARSGGFGGAA